MVELGKLASLAFENFSITEAFEFLKPLLLFVIGIVIYAIFIFKFYRFISKKNIFTIKLNATGMFAELKRGASKVYYALKYLIVYPLIIIFYFLVLVTFFAFLAKTQTLESIMLIAMALVASIRITSYYNEDLSRDLAKMIPFAILGVFLVEITYFSFDSAMESILSIPSFWKTIVYYLGFTVFLEFVMRTGTFVFQIKHKGSEKKSEPLIPKKEKKKS